MQNKTQIRQIIDVLKFNGIFQSKNLIAGIETINGTVRTDSRKIVEGDIFVAIKGFVTDGHYFVRQAVSQGASLIISEDFISCEISQIKVTDSRKATAIIINEITGKPTSKLKLIGITGTNGKTTSAFIAGNIFRQLNIKYGIIGTLGYYIEDEFYPSKLTTPDILDLNKIFLKMLKVGVEVVVMEVSAHAISLRRISGLEFDVACFTNLSRDHLDFYEDMDHYFDAKRMFIETTSARKGKVVINVEDEWGSKLYQLVKGRKYSIGSKNCDYVISAEQMLSDRSSFTMKYASETITFDVNLSARYNIRNAAMALIAVHLAYPDINITKVSLNNLDFVPGRLERIITSNGSTVFIDYAHTPEAVKKVLENIREFAKGRIITVCGAGGDRDRGKRPEMLTQALDNSDYVIITNDNPRYENPSSIIDEIVGGTDIEENFWIIRDRKLAIETAIKLAHKEDIVLIAGKGHEEYQEISGVRHPFSDKEVAINSHEKTELSNMLSVYIDLLMLTKVLKVDFKNDEDSVFKYVSTDSRSIKSHTVFFALKGGRFDGHNYLDNVLNDPTNWAVVSRRINHPRCIYVADTLKAYQDVAKKYLNLFNVHKIAITGSAGKTTTKEFLSNILSAKFKTHKTYANENNLIGLPKTIFKLTSAHQAVVFELGSNHPGEIEELAKICNPNISIVTLIGPSHLEFFGDLYGVFKEKTSLLKYTTDHKIFNYDDEQFKDSDIVGIKVGFGEDNDYQVKVESLNTNTVKIRIADVSYTINTEVPYLSLNASMAIVCAKLLNLTEEEIKVGLELKPKLSNRMEIIRSGKRTIISDCYNANPISMKVAIDFWKQYETEVPHLAFLGDMLELGLESESYHIEIGKSLPMKENIVTIGHYSQKMNALTHFENIERLLEQFDFQTIPDACIILLKGSNSIRLNKLMEKL